MQVSDRQPNLGASYSQVLSAHFSVHPLLILEIHVYRRSPMQNLSQFPARDREPPPTTPAVPEIRKETVLDFLKAFGLATQLTEPEKLQFIESPRPSA